MAWSFSPSLWIRKPRLIGRFFYAVVPLLAVALLPLASLAAGENPPALVKKIVIEGNKLIETETIRARLQTAEGSPFDPEKVSEDIRSLYSLGYFDDIQVNAAGFEGGLAVTFTLKEKSLITRIDFKGNEEVKTDDLRGKLELKTNAVVNEYDIKVNAERLLAFLREKGYYQAKVDYRLETVSEKETDLIYLITEGESLYVRNIDIQGNHAFTDEEIISAMKTQEKGFFSFVTKSGILVSEQLDDDVLRILSFLYNHGHLKARVENPKIEVDEAGKAIKIIIVINEGPRYRVGELTAPGDDLFKPEEILAVMKTTSGEIFRRDTYAQDLSAVTAMYTDIGYAFCRVDSTTDLDDQKGVVNLHLVIQRGAKVKVGRIGITGNQTTRDNVIRREFVLHEGEYFSSRLLARSRQKIMNLGFFDKVDITTEPRSDDIIDINIAVTERLTGTLSFGVGKSTDQKFGGIVKLSEDNVFGWGHKIQLSADISATMREYNLYYSDPAVWDSAYSLGFRIFNATSEYTQYDKKSTGGTLTIGHDLGEYMRGYLTYRDERDNVTNIAEGSSAYIASQAGKYNTRSSTITITRDARDNFFNPTTGTNTTLKFEYAGGFQGGDNYFTRTELEETVYTPLFWKFVFSVHGEFGYVKGFQAYGVPIYERYFLGGINSVRGYHTRSIGPKDENGDPIGGFTKLQFNVEVVFPLIEEQHIMGLVFFDAGQVYGEHESIQPKDLRTSTGFGIRWLSPIGPLRIEWGYVLDREPTDKHSDWEFTIGTPF